MSSSEVSYTLNDLLLLLTKNEDQLSIQVKDSGSILLFNKQISDKEACKVGQGLFTDLEELYEGLIEGFERINQSMSPILNQEDKKLTFYNKIMKGSKEKWLEVVLSLQDKESNSLTLSSKSSENCKVEMKPSSEQAVQKLEGKENKSKLEPNKESAVDKGASTNTAKPKSKLWWWQSAPHYSGLFE